MNTHHRLDGLEPDNLLAFLGLLGVLRCLEKDDASREPREAIRPRVMWSVDEPPLRPVLVLASSRPQQELLERIAGGLVRVVEDHDFDGQRDLNYDPSTCREIMAKAASESVQQDRGRADLLAALMTDGAIKTKDKKEVVDPTPLCLLFGQGHQHFLERLASIPKQVSPGAKSKKERAPDERECLASALFEPWARSDGTQSFRWDPEEDVRYALMAGDPTDAAYKTGTQHGANRLAAAGLAALTVVPRTRGGAARAAVVGGRFDRGFHFAWPIWRKPSTLSAVRAMLSHPKLTAPPALGHLGVEHVYSAKRISTGKFLNFTRAQVLSPKEEQRR
jgi:hypothetical protein